MLRKIITLAALIFSLAFMTTTATAWQLELKSSDNLTWEVLFTSDAGGNSLGGYFLDFTYDTSELNWADLAEVTDPQTMTGWAGEYTNTPPSGVSADFMGQASETSDGLIKNFNGFSLGAATVDGTFSFGTLTFDAVSPVDDGVADLQFAMDTKTFGMMIDDGAPSSDLAVIANREGYFAVSTNPVPLPGALWLVGSGLIGLLGIRRKNS